MVEFKVIYYGVLTIVWMSGITKAIRKVVKSS